MSDLLYAPHFANGRFFCPWGRFPNRFSDLLKWKMNGKGPYDRKAPLQIPVVANDGAYLKDRSQPVSVTWVGHSTFAVQDEGDVFLTDPHWGARALVPPRLSPPGIPLSAVPGHAFAVLSDPREGWQAFLDLGARHMVPMHWGAFDLTDEPPDLAPKVLRQILEEEGADPGRVHILAMGERWLRWRR